MVSFLEQSACNSQYMKTVNAFHISVGLVTNKGIPATEADSLLTGFNCDCWLDPGTFIPGHQLT